MQAIIFDLDHTIFDANQALHSGVADLLAILNNLGVEVGAVSNKDHRVLVNLDEAGIRNYFSQVLCNAHHESPKSSGALEQLLNKLGAEAGSTAFVSHAHSDILLGKDVGVAKTIGVSHGVDNIASLKQAGADYVVSDVPAVLDVLN